MRKELHGMIEDAKREITLAFKLAKKKFKETKITNITKIKNNMRNIHTETLTVQNVEVLNYQKGKKSTTFNRVLVSDESGNEGVIYLFDGRGSELKPRMHIKLVHGVAKTFSGETAIVLGKKGNIYIVL
ncbi:hypothetical protein HZC07_03845 [Candidatus Micrarchaeota archaeon]|nr:hypothetical protein [Candidatus Micrarchaeota archaeon]